MSLAILPKSNKLSHISTAEVVNIRLRNPVLCHLKWFVQVLKLPWTRDDWEMRTSSHVPLEMTMTQSLSPTLSLTLQSNASILDHLIDCLFLYNNDL